MHAYVSGYRAAQWIGFRPMNVDCTQNIDATEELYCELEMGRRKIARIRSTGELIRTSL